MGFSKSSSQREVYSNAVLPQETIKAYKVAVKRKTKQTNNNNKNKQTKKTPKVSRRKEIIKIRAEINEKEMKETIANINKTKSWFFEMINKIGKSLSRPIKKKGEKSNQQN